MVRPRMARCVSGRHDMTDPSNVIVRVRRGREDRACRACLNIRKRGYVDRPPLTAEQTRALQLIADGLTAEEAAEELCCTSHGVRARLKRARNRLGVDTDAAAVAVALMLELITPCSQGPRPPKRAPIGPYVDSLRALVQGRRRPLGGHSWERQRLLDVLYAFSEPHAVSILWAAERITAKHVQQRKDGSDAETFRPR